MQSNTLTEMYVTVDKKKVGGRRRINTQGRGGENKKEEKRKKVDMSKVTEEKNTRRSGRKNIYVYVCVLIVCVGYTVGRSALRNRKWGSN